MLKKIISGFIFFVVGSMVLSEMTAEMIKQRTLSKVWLLHPLTLYYYMK